MKSCVYCGAPLDDDALFCSNCGKKIEPLGKICPRCGAEVMADSAFCYKCGSRIDAQTVTPAAPLQEEENESFDRKEEKNRRRWFIICTIVITSLAYGSYCTFNHFYNTHNEENIQLSSEEESFFIDLVKRWDETHNHKEFDEGGENNPYAQRVIFYGEEMSGIDAHLRKLELLSSRPDFRQNSENIKVTKITEKFVICNFDKNVLST